MNRHFSLRSSPKHRCDLHKEFKKNRKCYCFRGGMKLANSFGSWDSLALEVPPDNVNPDHICDHSSLLSNHKPPTRKTLPSIAKHPGGRRCEGALSLGYLSRSGKNTGTAAGSLQFHHFNSVEEHIKYYRENKPNSLYSPSTETTQPQQEEGELATEPEHVPPITMSFGQSIAAMAHGGGGGGDVVLPGSSLTLTQTKPPTCTLTQKVYHIRHPHTFPLRALGKAIMPSYASLIMRVPSLNASSDNYWVPVNAVLQKGGDSHSWETGSNQQSDTSSSDIQPHEFPSLRRKTTWRHADSFKKRSSTRRAARRVDRQDRISEEPEDDTMTSHPSSSTGGEGREGVGSAMLQPSTTTNRSFTGPGRLLSGQLRSSSVHPTHLQDIVVGIQKSPYERLMPKLHITSCGRRVAKKAASAKRGKTRMGSADALSHDGTEKPRLSSAADGMRGTEDESGADSMKKADSLGGGNEEGLALNKLDITSENSGVEDWTGDDADFSTLKLELEPVSASTNKNSSQESSKNVSLTFNKPKKLFRLTSTHTRLFQSAKPLRQDAGKGTTTTTAVSTRARAQFTSRRGEYYPSQDAKHRLALDREEGPTAQGAFGVQSHLATKCMLRCQERRKMRLGSRRVGREEEAANRKKIQVYLIKTKRSLEDILPHLMSEKYCFDSSKPAMDLYDE